MKKVLFLVLFCIPFLFQNCTQELHEIDAVISPEFEDLIVDSDDTLENSSVLVFRSDQ